MSTNIKDDTFRIILDGKSMKNTDDLFTEVSTKLNFPDYFGNNWNALYDCLLDFAWINQDKIEIQIINQEFILNPDDKDEKEFFYKILKYAKDFWTENKTKEFDFLIS